jgi:hypothetical protein
VLAETVEHVTCRWCGSSQSIENLDGQPVDPSCMAAH